MSGSRSLLVPVALAVSTGTLAVASPPHTAEGRWTGAFQRGDEWVAIRLQLETSGGSLRGRADVPGFWLRGAPIDRIEQQGSRLRVTLDAAGLVLTGEIQGSEITGEAATSTGRAPLRLLRSVALEPQALAGYAGIYGPLDGRYLHVQPWDELGPDRLGLFDDDGSARGLEPIGADRFVAGASLSGVVPVEARLLFARDAAGRVAELLWQPEGGAPRRLPRAEPCRVEDVSFTSGGIRLSGTLRVPSSPGRHPAIVLVHGSGPAGRGQLLPFVAPLLSRGYAVLGYDKRGVGGSEGHWLSATFDALADDALAAVAFLRARPDVDPTAVGLMGASQGGWVAPLAASRSDAVAFVVSLSGPAVSPAEETADFVEHEMRAEGFTDAEVAAALALKRLRDGYARTGSGWDELQAAAARVQAEPWYLASPLPPREDPFWPFWRGILDYDPAPALAALRAPVLAVFGGRDRNVLAQKNAERWEAALRRGGHQDYTLVTFPSGNHMLFEARLGTVAESFGLRRFVPGYAETLRAWLQRRVPPRGDASPHSVRRR